MSAAGDIGGSRMGGVVVRFERCCVFGSHHKAGRPRVPAARCAPPRHRCRKGNRPAEKRPSPPGSYLRQQSFVLAQGSGPAGIVRHSDRRAAALSVCPSVAFNRLGPSDEIDACLIVRDGSGRRSRTTSILRRSRGGGRRHTRIQTTLTTPNQLPSWGIPWGSGEYLLFKTRFGTVGEPNEVICQSQQDRFCLGVRSARHRERFSGTVVPIGWIVRKPGAHIRRSPNPPPTPQHVPVPYVVKGRK
jgi:hypothetical protein